MSVLKLWIAELAARLIALQVGVSLAQRTPSAPRRSP
jgi:hypothetical protein